MTLTTGGAQGCCGKNSFAPVLEPNGYEDYLTFSAKSGFFNLYPLKISSEEIFYTLMDKMKFILYK